VLAAGDAAQGLFQYRRDWDRTVALHESGHACALALCGFRFHSVSVESDGRTAGRVWLEEPTCEYGRSPSDNKIAALYMRVGSGSAQESRKGLRRVRKVARRFIADNWPLVRSVASELEERRVMTASEVVGCIGATVARLDRYAAEQQA
jgi:hypothetical protein